MSNAPDQLPVRETAALRSLAVVAGSLGVPLLLIGAVARQLVFDYAYALPTRRTTRDLDFGVQVPDWSTFLRLRQATIDSGHFAATTRPHALIHQATSLPIDLVPFGGLETQGVIRWPNDSQEMVVTGFDDAYDHAIEVQITPDLRVRVATLPLLAALKLFAFADRGGELRKDLDDLLFMIEHYSTACGPDRLYEPPLNALVMAADFDVQYAGALLLGFDLAQGCRPETRQRVLPIVDSLTDSNASCLTPFVRTYDEDEEQRRRQLMAARFTWLARGIRVATIS